MATALLTRWNEFQTEIERNRDKLFPIMRVLRSDRNDSLRDGRASLKDNYLIVTALVELVVYRYERVWIEHRDGQYQYDDWRNQMEGAYQQASWLAQILNIEYVMACGLTVSTTPRV